MFSSRNMRIACAIFAASLIVLVATSAARADVMGFDLGVGNPGISPTYTGPYAHVQVDRTSDTTATITFTSLTNGGYIYLLGDGGSAGVNANASSSTVTNITGTNSYGTSFTPGPYSNDGAGQEDGFGIFNQRVTSFDGFAHSADKITFTLTNTSGTWASVFDVLTPNAGGYSAAAHIFVANSDLSNTTNTGYATVGGDLDFSPSVPLPSVASASLLSLCGAGLLVGVINRRRRQTA
jgi:hypothetical protein